MPSEIVVFITLGALFTLRLDPRSHCQHQVIAMMGGMLLIVVSGMLGAFLVGHSKLAIVALVIISYLAGQPKLEQKYFSLLGKFVAAAFVLEAVGSPVTLTTAIATSWSKVVAKSAEKSQTRVGSKRQVPRLRGDKKTRSDCGA